MTLNLNKEENMTLNRPKKNEIEIFNKFSKLHVFHDFFNIFVDFIFHKIFSLTRFWGTICFIHRLQRTTLLTLTRIIDSFMPLEKWLNQFLYIKCT